MEKVILRMCPRERSICWELLARNLDEDHSGAITLKSCSKRYRESA